MFRRIVLMTWKDGATQEQRDAVAEELGKLPSVIPEIRRFDVGVDRTAGNADLGVLADFDNTDDWAAYVKHPAHQAVVTNHIGPIVAARTAIQYEYPA